LSLERLTPAYSPADNETSDAIPDDPERAQPVCSNEEASILQDITIRTTYSTLTGVPRPTQSTISSCFHKPLSNKKNQEIDFSHVEATVKNYLPFQTVESHHLKKKFVHKLNGAYKMPIRKTVSDVLLYQMYIMTKEKVKHSLESADAVTITMDGWTSIRNESYLAVRAHYINSHMD
jgi:hypothetical protein